MGSHGWFVVVAVLAGTGAEAAAARCRLFNNTGIDFALHRNDGTYVSPLGRFDIKPFDGAAFELRSGHRRERGTCRADTLVRLRDGAVVVEVIPRWLAISAADVTVTVKVPRDASVTVDGAPRTPVKGVVAIQPDLRRNLLAAPLGDDGSLSNRVPVAIEASRKGVTVTVLVGVPTDLVANEDSVAVKHQLLATLRESPGRGVDWAAPLAGNPPHPAVVLTCYADCAPATQGLMGANRLARLADAQLLVIERRGSEDIETCSYTNMGRLGLSPDGTGTQLLRRRLTLELRVFEARTGKELATKKFVGAEPKPCPETVFVLDGQAQQREVGPEPDPVETRRWLAGY